MSFAHQEGVLWLQSLARFGIKPGLARTKRVLTALSNPEESLRFYHVAGTNGKGSVCAILTALFGATGVTVGTFTSPSFDGYRGRFVVNGQPISETRFAELALIVKETAEAITPSDMLTEFEVLTVMAILYFQEMSVDAVVWETGLGGRYDSTNVVTPTVTAITNVSYDHVEILGPTLADIAYEKAGIIKAGIPLVTAAEGEAYLVIEKVAKQVGAFVLCNRRSFATTQEAMTIHGQRFSYRGMWRDTAGLWLPLFGAHQSTNAAVALAVYEIAVWLNACPRLTDSELNRALQSVFWPGRFEIFPPILEHGIPLRILDGAHNSDGILQMVKGLAYLERKLSLPLKNWTLVLGILADKDVETMLSTVLPAVGRVVVTEPTSPRTLSSGVLAAKIDALYPELPVEIVPNVEMAMRHAEQYNFPVVCAGSLYTVDEARKAMEKRNAVV